MDPQDVALKERFAEAFLRDPEALRAALAVVGPNHSSQALAIATTWPHDPYVIDYQAMLIEKYGADHFLPDKLQLAREIWRHAENIRDPDAKTKALKLYGEVTGILNREPHGPSSVVNNKVMIIVDKGTNAQWEKSLAEQQDKLMLEASQST